MLLHMRALQVIKHQWSRAWLSGPACRANPLSCTVLVVVHVLQVTKQSNGKLTVVGKNKDDEEKTLEDVDFVLMATGRKPRTQGLGLEEVG